MSFEIDGFFSPEVEGYRSAVRTTEPFKSWFAYALELNRMGMDLLKQALTPLTDKRQMAMHAHFVRAHQGFQGALLLLERGLVPDARTLLRSGTESAIAIHALGNDAAFVDKMVDAHYLQQRKRARVLLNTPEYIALYSAEQIAAMHATIAEVDTIEATKSRKLQDIKWEQVAAKICPDLYRLMYRDLSGDGTHATLNSLDRFVLTDADNRITAFKLAPDTDGLVEALRAACLLFLWAAVPFASICDRADVSAELSNQMQLYAKLPGAFP